MNERDEWENEIHLQPILFKDDTLKLENKNANWFCNFIELLKFVNKFSLSYLQNTDWLFFFDKIKINSQSLKIYNFGEWSQMMNKDNYFIFYEKNSAYCTWIAQMTLLPSWHFY
jgi:hypothetical protein